jgi:polygalacturonase
MTGTYQILDFGAVGDGVTLNTAAINAAIAACASAGGGTVVVPPGIFVAGTIVLLSNVTLHLLAGAIIKGSPNVGDLGADQRSCTWTN